MRKITEKLAKNRMKKFEQFEPDVAQPIKTIDIERLQKLINMTSPLLDEISNIIVQDDDRVISIEYYNKIISAVDALDELKNIF